MADWSTRVLSAEQKLQIEEAIAKAELLTNAEMVPMIVRRSSEAHESIRGFVLGTLLGLMTSYVLAEFFALHGYAYLIPGLGALGFFASYSPSFARLLVGSTERRRAAEIRAELEFSRLKISRTKDRVGILLFVSEFDHQVVVLADEAIAKVLDSGTWSEVCSMIILGLKTGTFSSRIIEAIGKMGNLCAVAFPPKSVNINEIENHIIVKD